MLHETLVENGIELEQEIFHLTDSGSDEVSIGNVAFNALHLLLGRAFKFTHGRGDVGHNHTFLDLLGALGKLALQGNRQGTGMPTHTTTELVAVLKKVAEQSNPGATTSVKVMRAAHDFSGILQHVTPFTGSSDYRLMALHKDSSSKGVTGQLCRDLASKLPQALTLEKGGVADSFEVLHADAMEACSGNLPMAAHDEAGIEKARIGLATTLRVLKAPGRCGLRLPPRGLRDPACRLLQGKDRRGRTGRVGPGVAGRGAAGRV